MVLIEQAIYFGVGCAAAGLLALAFLPVLWARAVRLTRQRLQRQIPVSMQEVLADRDHLRAEFAVERRRLEQEMERVQAGKAKDMGELGRRSAEVHALSESLAGLRSAAAMRETTLAELLRDLAEAGAQAGALQMALQDTHAHLDRKTQDLEMLRRARDALEESAEQRRLTVAALNTRTMGLEMTIEDGQRARSAMERQIEAMRQREGGASGWDAGQPNDLPAAQARIRQLEADLQAAAQEAKQREKGIHLQRSLQAERARGESRAELEKVEALHQEIAGLRGALEAARQAGGGQGSEAPPDIKGDAQLRASIHEIGLAVARMTAATGRSADDDKPLSVPPRPETAATAPSLV